MTLVKVYDAAFERLPGLPNLPSRGSRVAPRATVVRPSLGGGGADASRLDERRASLRDAAASAATAAASSLIEDDITRDIARESRADVVMSAAAFMTLVATDARRRDGSWDIPITMTRADDDDDDDDDDDENENEKDAARNRARKVMYVDAPLPTRDLTPATARRRAAGVYEREMTHRATQSAAAVAAARFRGVGRVGSATALTAATDAGGAGAGGAGAARGVQTRALFALGDKRVLVRSRTTLRDEATGRGVVLKCKVDHRAGADDAEDDDADGRGGGDRGDDDPDASDASDASDFDDDGAGGGGGGGGARRRRGARAAGDREEVSRAEAAEWWASLAVRPGSTLALARVGAYGGVLLDVERKTIDDARAFGADPTPPPPYYEPSSLALQLDGGDVGNGNAGDDDDDDDEDGDEIVVGGQWFTRNGFDPADAARALSRALDDLSSLPVGRYIISLRCGSDVVDVYEEKLETEEAKSKLEASRSEGGGDDALALTLPELMPAGVEPLSKATSPPPPEHRRPGRPRKTLEDPPPGALPLALAAAGVGPTSTQSAILRGVTGGGVHRRRTNASFLFGASPLDRLTEKRAAREPKPEIAEPLLPPRARAFRTAAESQSSSSRGPKVGVTYDVNVAFETCARHAAKVAAMRIDGGNRDGGGDENGENGENEDAETPADREKRRKQLDTLFEVLPPTIHAPSHVRRTFTPHGDPPTQSSRRARKAWTSLLEPPSEDAAAARGGGGGGGETASHTTPFAWCTPFLKDFSRRHSLPALPFQRLTGKTFD